MKKYVYFISFVRYRGDEYHTFGRFERESEHELTDISHIKEIELSLAEDLGCREEDALILNYILLRTEEAPEVDVPQA